MPMCDIQPCFPVVFFWLSHQPRNFATENNANVQPNKLSLFMKANSFLWQECHLAGRKYYDVDEVWSELKVGTHLQLEREADNKHDVSAVQVIYERPATELQPSKRFLLGYVPADSNELLAQMMDMGWQDVFFCRISQINTTAYSENQIRIAIRVRRNERSESCPLLSQVD